MSGPKQQSVVLTDGWRVASTWRRKPPRSGLIDASTPSGSASNAAPAAAAGSSAPAVEVPNRSDAAPDHGVKRVRCSPQVQDTEEFNPDEPMETAEVQSQ